MFRNCPDTKIPFHNIPCNNEKYLFYTKLHLTQYFKLLRSIEDAVDEGGIKAYKYHEDGQREKGKDDKGEDYPKENVFFGRLARLLDLKRIFHVVGRYHGLFNGVFSRSRFFCRRNFFNYLSSWFRHRLKFGDNRLGRGHHIGSRFFCRHNFFNYLSSSWFGRRFSLGDNWLGRWLRLSDNCLGYGRLVGKDGTKPGDGSGNLLRSLTMGLQGDRLETKAGGIDVKVFVGDKEKIVFACGAKTAQPGEHHGLALLQDGLHLRKEIAQDPTGVSLFDLVGAGVEGRQQRVGIILTLTEIEPAIWRLDGVAPIGKRCRNDLGHETPDARERHFIVVKDQFLDHLG